MNHKLELMDQFDDAAFALMMDEYAEAEGERLRAEFEEAMRSGTAPACPPELDEKCRKQIKRHFGKQRRSAWAGIARRAAGRAAACLLIALGISAALIVSVEALRVPFLESLMKQHGTTINFDFTKLHEDPDTEPYDPLQNEYPFAFFVPDGYENILQETKNGRINSLYKTEDGRFIEFSMRYSNQGPSQSTDPDYGTEQFEMPPYEAQYSLCYYSEEGWPVSQVEWYDPEIETMYWVGAKGLDKLDLIEICENVAEAFSALTIDEQAKVANALAGKLPPNYELMHDNLLEGYPIYLYKDEKRDEFVSFSILFMDGGMKTFIEDAVLTEITVAGFDASHMVGSEEMGTMWFDLDRELYFYLVTNAMTEQDHLALCEYLAEYYKDVTLPAVSTVIWD